MAVCNKRSLISFLFAAASYLQGTTAVEVNRKSLENIISKFQKVNFGKDKVANTHSNYYDNYYDTCINETFMIMDDFGNEIGAVFNNESDIFMQMMMCLTTQADYCTIDFSLAAKDLSIKCDSLGGDFIPLDVKSENCQPTEGGMPFTDFSILSFPMCVSKSCADLGVDIKPLLKELENVEPFNVCDEVKISVAEKPEDCKDSVGMGPLDMSCFDIGKRPEKFCKKKAFQKFCPKTCGLCGGPHPCKDDIGKFKIGNKKMSCKLAAKRPWKFCSKVGVQEHCPVACKTCGGGLP